jgi:uncharacterized protein (TIGR02145 family)
MVPSSSYDLTGAVWKNRKQVIDNNKMTPDGIANKLYYPLNGSDVRFVAYYPYTASASETATLNKVSVDFADQSTQTKKEAKDFMFHRGTADYSKANPNASLGFHHKFSKILMTVKMGTGGPSVKDVKVTLSGMPASATVDLDKLSQRRAVTDADSIAVGTQAGDIAAFTHTGATETTATVEAIVAPHTGEGNFSGRVFTFTTSDNQEFRYALADNVEFEQGKVYNFTFTLIPAELHDGMTNCYMVVPGDKVEFPVSRAYEFKNNAFTDKLHVGTYYTGPFTAAVVWDDNSVISGTPTVSGSGKSAKVTVQTNSGKSGNAVVAIKKGSDIVWSYHIWVTNYDGTATWTNPNQTAFTFMDRNLGATAAALSLAGRGLIYQFGRKDPFPGGKSGIAGYAALSSFKGMPGAGSTTAVKVSSSANAGAIVESIQNPATFYIQKANVDWLPALDNNLWSTNSIASGKKTIYDPCPSGWRVPARTAIGTSNDYSPWKGLSSKSFTSGDTGGANWGTNALFPATGYRHYNNGNFGEGGSNGHYWSASPSGSSYNTLILAFSSGYVGPSYSTYRAIAFSVRCVQE